MQARYIDWCRQNATSGNSSTSAGLSSCSTIVADKARGANSPKAIDDRNFLHEYHAFSAASPLRIPASTMPTADSTRVEGTLKEYVRVKPTGHSGSRDLSVSTPVLSATTDSTLSAVDRSIADDASIANSQSKPLPRASFARTILQSNYAPASGAPLTYFNASLPFMRTGPAGNSMNKQGSIFTVPAVDTNGRRIDVRWNPALRMLMPMHPPSTAPAASATAVSGASAGSSAATSNEQPILSQVRPGSSSIAQGPIPLKKTARKSTNAQAAPAINTAFLPFDGADRSGGKARAGYLAPKTNANPVVRADHAHASGPAKVQGAAGKKTKPRSKAKVKAEQPLHEAWWAQARLET